MKSVVASYRHHSANSNSLDNDNVQPTDKELTHPSFHRDSRCLLMRSRIASIHSQKGKLFSFTFCSGKDTLNTQPIVNTHGLAKTLNFQ